MDLIPSFSVDHTKIIPGIYISRVDDVNGEKVTTYDIRMKRPNIEPAIDVAAMHSLEHLIATYLRNDDYWKDDVIYFGPMGCLTGFYLILKGNKDPHILVETCIDAFNSVLHAEKVPGSAPVNCGNYLMHNLNMAKWYAREFVEYLECNINNEQIYNYPKTERLVTAEGQQFFDS